MSEPEQVKPQVLLSTEKQIAESAKAFTKLELVELLQHYQYGDDANLHWMPSGEWYELTELLLAAWKQGRIHKLFPTEADALKLITRVAEHNWSFKRQGAENVLACNGADALLAQSHIAPHPAPRLMLRAMNAALSRRDHEFFRRLAAQLKRNPVVLGKMQTKLMRLAFKHWATEYRCPDGTSIPALVELDDMARRNFLVLLEDWNGNRQRFQKLVAIAANDALPNSVKVVRDLLKDFPKLPLKRGQKKPHRKSLSKDILRKIRPS